MILADITFSTEGIVVISALMTALTGAVVYLFKALQTNSELTLTAQKEQYEKQLVALNSDRNSWKEMAYEVGINLEKAVNRKRAKEGRPAFEVTAPVVAEHSSPVTRQQQETAEISTMRARVVQATKELELAPRVGAELATEQVERDLKKSAPAQAKADADGLIEEKNIGAALHDAGKAIEVAHDAVDEASQISKDSSLAAVDAAAAEVVKQAAKTDKQ